MALISKAWRNLATGISANQGAKKSVEACPVTLLLLKLFGGIWGE